MSSRMQRAERRRATWTSEVVTDHRRKDSPYADASRENRVLALWRLSHRAWRASGQAMPAPVSRQEWPGEIFELPRRG